MSSPKRLTAVAAAFGLVVASSNSSAQSMPTLLDLGNSFVHFGASTQWNQLYAEIEGRMTLSGVSGPREYLLMAQHPREETFNDNGEIYAGEVAKYGASMITFMYDPSDDSMILSRRFERPTTALKQECIVSPYNGGLPTSPATIPPDKLVELFDRDDIFAAASAQKKILGVLEYSTEGVNVTIEFPADIINFNPDQAAPIGKQWQIASSQVPIYVAHPTHCESIKSGYVAFGRVGAGVTLSFVYLCEQYNPEWSQDFSCPVNYTGSVRLFARQ